jgi:hypothetical protein
VSLCQPDSIKSCGACCGLYNWHDHGRETLVRLLRGRTTLFRSFGQDLQLEAYSLAAKELTAGRKLLDDIYNCEFLGFLDEEERRVGCLLHPSVNKGLDLRDSSFYGPSLCAAHMCPSHEHLTETEKLSVIESLEDWYLYGLVITDIDLVKEFSRHAQDRLGDIIRPECLHDEGVRAALRAFFELKAAWRFASAEPRLGKYYFTHSEYRVARIDYEKRWKIGPSRFDRILISLSSEFQTEAEVREAEAVIEEKLGDFVQAYQKAAKYRCLAPDLA